MTLFPGTRLGPYEIIAPLGAGGMGDVYRATDTRLHRTIAIKTISEQLRDRSDLRQRFKVEAEAIGALVHPHICQLYDVGEQDGIEFLVLEFVEGETLAARLSHGKLQLDQALRAAGEIAGALDAAHRRGIVHRDLKPSNVMLTRTGVKLLDFGLARRREADFAGIDTGETLTAAGGSLTEAGTRLGTWPYMAPEQIRGEPADWRCDIFAFGALLYEMITGRRQEDRRSG